MNKICTSQEQSKKLIELGIDETTADMFWDTLSAKNTEAQVDNHHLVDEYDDWYRVPAWSLSALMNLLPSEFTEVGEYSETTYKIDIRKYALTDDVDIYQIAYGNYRWYEDGSCSWSDLINTGEKEEIIDAVFQMIVWLLENEKLIN